MKAVILAGGYGTRISEESQAKPKPLIEIGGMPILWHIMKGYSAYGIHEFIICAGYKQEMIKEWFNHYTLYQNDVTFDMNKGEVLFHTHRAEPWRVTVVDTGLGTMTGGRVKRVQRYIADEPFLLTYGDAVCDVDIGRLIAFHREHGKLVTLTSVLMDQSKGVLDIGGDNAVRAFREKSKWDSAPINAGYMVMEPAVFDLLTGDDCILEHGPMDALARRSELMSYRHRGFWQCMDTMREKMELETLWASGKAPWKIWNDSI